MNNKIYGIILMMFFCINTMQSQQWTQSFENLSMYRINIDGLSGEEQAIYVSRIITEMENVLIAKIYPEGDGIIFTESEIDFNKVYEKLAIIPGLTIKDRYKETSSKDEYLSVYNNYGREPVSDLSKRLPSPINIIDPQKQSRAYSVLKKIWIEKYPDVYKSSFPTETDQSEAEKAEKLIKESN